MPALVNYHTELTGNPVTHLNVEKQLKQEALLSKEESLIASATEGGGDSKEDERPTMQTAAPMANRDSVISTVSSISEPSVVEAALKAGASTAANGKRRVISNLVSGLHSFTTLIDKESSQDGNSTRSAPVVNALKLAEKSRLLEEKKQLEKEKRRAALKKKLDEHKKAAALKEKSERDARGKREQERLNERKKREAELARKRQQKVKEMRAGLEKKRAMLAAEKRSGIINGGMPSKTLAVPSAPAQQKHRGLVNVPDSSKPATKPLLKPIPKPMPKPVSKQAPKLASKAAAKPMKTQVAPVKLAPKSPEIVNYEMSDNAESSDGDSSDSDSEHHGKKKVPKWAQKNHLNKILHAQFGKNAVDPSPTIFKDFVDTCDLESIFETTDMKKKKKFARRTSSGNWLADRPTARDRALYQRDMGYDRVSDMVGTPDKELITRGEAVRPTGPHQMH
ncbi:hypothetical protein BBJ29_007420 [Phytophthora kernoviae]|uniref:Inner centromere protein ARK-binding domain-containing protein n=1 Tax=Phytophthora kernoviae TaxID=325452 RepID=A0A3F2RPX0_9STRA|nr:hypothetical protein BBP00_00005116 [Phytophthora kernoviae]RLN69399.1 hypothetical protein BBJ29_007420 [Phytophthora kernoviae]